MQTKIVGGGTIQAGVEWQIDPLWGAGRMSLRPLDYTNINQEFGHFRIGATSGALAGAAGASAVFSARWSPIGVGIAYAVLLRLQIHALITTAFTTPQLLDFDAIIQRAFTAADTGGTALTPFLGNNQKMRAQMNTSQMSDMRIASTAALGAGTKTPDANPFGYAVFPNNNTLSSAATKWDAAQFQTMYAADQPGQGHPIIMNPNEGFNIRPITALGAVGVIKIYVITEWAELSAF